MLLLGENNPQFDIVIENPKDLGLISIFWVRDTTILSLKWSLLLVIVIVQKSFVRYITLHLAGQKKRYSSWIFTCSQWWLSLLLKREPFDTFHFSLLSVFLVAPVKSRMNFCFPFQVYWFVIDLKYGYLKYL